MPQKVRRFTAAFTAGELGPTLRGRRDVGIYYLGMSSLKNIVVRPQGPARVRPGIRHVASQPAQMRLAGFGDSHIVVFLPELVRVYDKSTLALVSEIDPAPFVADDLDLLTWVHVGDVMLIASTNQPLKELARGTPWTIADYVLEAPPQHRYHADRRTILTPSAATGNITLTASGGTNNAVFNAGQVDEIWEIGSGSSSEVKRVRITGYTSPTQASATVIDALPSDSGTRKWTQQAHSSSHGYYRSIAYHNQRLCLGGTRDAGWRLWLSRVGAPYDFQIGSENDEPIWIDIADGEANILHLVSGSGGLEIFTDQGEVIIPAGVDAPITPATIMALAQSAYGTRQRVRPARLDAMTIFAQRDAGAIREYIYSEVEQAYQSTPLTVRASHLSSDPVAMVALSGGFGIQSDFLLVANADGSGAIMTSVRSEEVTAWSAFASSLLLRDFATVGDRAFVATQDDAGAWALGWLDPEARFDGQLSMAAESPSTSWAGFDHLAGRTIQLYGDGYERQDVQVNDEGTLGSDDALTSIEAGLQIPVEISPLPIELEQQSLSGRPVRVFSLELRYLYSSGLRVRLPDGTVRIIPDRPFDDVINLPPQLSAVPKTHRVRTGAGWRRDDMPPLTITREGSGPFEVVSLALDCVAS